VHYGKNNGIPSEVASISIVTLWIWAVLFF
jgi:hypothetical protein